MNKEAIFRKLYENNVKRWNYINKLPIDISDAFFDNEYVNLLGNDNDILLSYVFGDHKESIEWFLYEWDPDTINEVGFNGVTEKIENIDQYIDWMKRNEGFKND